MEKKGDSEIAIENKLQSVIDHLNKENASLKENVSDLEIMILDLRNKMEDNTCLAEKYESLLNSESKCKIKNEQLMIENSKLKEEKEQLKNELLSLSNETRDLKEKIAQFKLEEEIQAMSSDLGNMCLGSFKVEKSEISLQCDMINELHEKKLSDLRQMLDETKANLLMEKDSKKMLEEEKNDEIMHLQNALKAFLQEKCQGQEEMKNLESERAKLEEKINCLESEVKESNKALREMIKEKRQEDDQNKSKVFEGSEKLLEVLKEELEKKGETIQRLLEDNQSIRDVVLEKERELQSFSENHEKQFKHYESLVSKLREDIEMHNREEMRLRSLLQIGTPNKYEKSYLNVSSELSQLKKQLSAELCRDCSVKVLPMEKKNSSLSDVRGTVSNENMAPIGRTRRRSKSQPSYSLVDYCEYDDDSDFELEKKPRGRNRRNRAERTFTGMEANLNESERSDEPGEPKTPFSKSRRLLNPKDGSTFLDLKEHVPILPRTPADVIKRMLRPRKH
ncbi:hypothetical protein J437_LFUL012284 [Ladona fulva]|uniref:Uncharacterized protein n=1 Tax=Ladona fulva TaxID=123851 RepID=A0A8K0P3C7_LADFU|nr:hypothetical protein J437_LFUL012284 [Ladona fulva]